MPRPLAGFGMQSGQARSYRGSVGVAGRWVLVAALLGLVMGGCSTAESPGSGDGDGQQADHAALDHVHNELVLLDSAERVRELFKQGTARFTQENPFRQVGFFYRADPQKPLQWRVRGTNGEWSEWDRVEVTWREDALHVGRVVLQDEAMELELRGGEGMDWGQVEFYDEVVANMGTLARDLPFVEEKAGVGETSDSVLNGDFATTRQELGPSNLVISRSQWGARNPGKVCWGAHTPNRMSIHHTYSPATDGGDAAAAMRGMQAYHIDTNGWCDIGYHFVVSQAGKVYQGVDEVRYGAHVGGQNTGNIGICLIGNFQPGYSNSQTPSETQLRAAGSIVGWVHETYNIPLNRQKVLGHRENPGQSTTCPGDNLLSRITKIFDYANPTPLNYDISAKVNLTSIDNFYTQGSSADIKDALPGDKFKAEIIIKNKSEGVIRNVWAGYAIPEPFLKATNYRIDTDYPKLDGSTWVLNDADDEADNPARDGMGKSGKFNLNAFSPNESKRILVDLEATQYSLAADKPAEIQGWLNRADSATGALYSEQTSYDGSVSTNELDGKVQGKARVDVLERDLWLFDDTADAGNLEGWTGQPEGSIAELKLNTSLGLMSVKIAGEGVALVAPDWTKINADQFDQLVLRYRSHDGPHTMGIYWAADGEDFSGDRSVSFEAPGDTEFNELVVDLSAHSAWQGNITRLRIDPLVDAAPGEEDSGWYDFDEIFFQSSEDESTSGPGLVDYVDATPVQPGEGVDPDDPMPDPRPTDPTNPDDPNNPGNPGDPSQPPGDRDHEQNPNDDASPRVQVNSSGCSATGTPGPIHLGWLLIAGGGFAARRRQ